MSNNHEYIRQYAREWQARDETERQSLQRRFRIFFVLVLIGYIAFALGFGLVLAL